MKTLRSPILLLSAALAGCVGFGSFELSIAISEQRVQGSPLGGLLGGLFDLPIPLDVDLAVETAARQTGPAQRVRLLALTLDITETAESATDQDDFGFIDSVDIFVESRRSDSALPRRRVAWIESSPGAVRQLVFETDTSVDLLPYVQEGARLSSAARARVPPDDVTFVGAALLSVEVL